MKNCLKPTTLILIIATLISYIRLYVGIDTTDESQYIAQIVLPIIGGTPFVSDLFIQQSAQLLLSPLCWLYTLLFGFDHIVLFVRTLYWLVASASLVIWWQAFNEYRNKLDTALLLTPLILFAPCSLTNWSYNTISQLLLPLSLLLLFRARFATGKRYEFVAAGILSAITCISYPTTALIYLLVMLGIATEPPVSKTSIRHFLWPIVGGSALFALYLLLFVGTDVLLQSLSFSSRLGVSGGYEKLCWMSRQIITSISPWPAAILGLLVLLSIFDRKLYLIKSWLLLLSIFCYMIMTNQLTDYPVHGWILYMTFVVCFLRNILEGRNLLAPLPRHLDLVAKYAIVTGLIFGYTSSNGTINCPIGFLPALCIYLIQLLNTLTLLEKDKSFIQYWSITFAGCIALYFSYSPFAFIYRDTPVWSTAQKVTTGPFNGIYSTPDNVALLTFLQEDLTELAKTKKTIFASYLAPAYFFTKMRPVTRMLNIHPIYWTPDRVDEILEQTKKYGEFPDVVVTRKFGPQFTYQFENYFLSTGKYVVAYQRSWYQILIRNNS